MEPVGKERGAAFPEHEQVPFSSLLEKPRLVQAMQKMLVDNYGPDTTPHLILLWSTSAMPEFKLESNLKPELIEPILARLLAKMGTMRRQPDFGFTSGG
jgi:hypothetical protein